MSNFFELSKTYANWKSQFSSTQLASNGFKFTGVGDTVECVVCGIKLSDWSMNDQILERHYNASPDCVTVQNMILQNNGQTNNHSNNTPYKGNPLTSQQQVNPLSTLNYPNVTTANEFETRSLSNRTNKTSNLPVAQMRQYENETARLATFSTWPADSPVSAAVLARAGLFYTGVRDKVKCPYCLGSMYNWEVEDNPLSEHAKHYKTCPFVKWKQNEYLKPPVDSYSDLLKQFGNYTLGGGNVGEIVSDCVPFGDKAILENTVRAANMSASSIQQQIAAPVILPEAGGAKPKQQRQKQQLDFANSKAVKIVQDMGYSMGIIRKACKTIPDLDLAKLKSDVLLDALFDVESNGYESGEESGDDEVEQLVTSSQNTTADDDAIRSAARSHLPQNNPANVQHPNTHTATSNYNSSNTQAPTLLNAPEMYSNENKENNKPVNKMNTVNNITTAKTNFSSDNQTPIAPIVVTESSVKNFTQLIENKMCLLCQVKPADMLLIPCMHLSCCEACTAKTNHCPRCGQVIAGTMRVYLS